MVYCREKKKWKKMRTWKMEYGRERNIKTVRIVKYSHTEDVRLKI